MSSELKRISDLIDSQRQLRRDKLLIHTERLNPAMIRTMVNQWGIAIRLSDSKHQFVLSWPKSRSIRQLLESTYWCFFRPVIGSQ